MKTRIYSLLAGVAALAATSAARATILVSLEPSSQNIIPGSSASPDLVISRLGDHAPPSLGAFDLDVSYDPAVLTPISVKFGSLLDLGAGLFNTGVDANGNCLPDGVADPHYTYRVIPETAFQVSVPFVITRGFKAGKNTIDFVVDDGGGYVTGLRVAGMELQDYVRPTTLFDTGVDDNGNCLADGAPDPHYQIVEAAEGPLPLTPVTANSYCYPLPSPWAPNDPTGSSGSKWIALGADTYGTYRAIYVYRTVFTLPAGVDPASVKITGSWSTDDVGRSILLNGVPTSNLTLEPGQLPLFYTLLPFAITEGFKAGENVLDFVFTNNGGGPTGLRVDNIQLVYPDEHPLVAYRAAGDFSIAQNPNGTWSYGWSDTRGGPFHLDTQSGEDTQFGHLLSWIEPRFEDGSLHIAYAAASVNHPTYQQPLGTINLLPGPAGWNTVLRWTAPATGAYQIVGYFIGNDFGFPTTTDVAILRNGTERLAGEVNGYGEPVMFALLETMTAGETIDFTVGSGWNQDYHGDATGLEVIIRPVTPGDFNGDGCVNRTDLALLLEQVRARSTNLAYDLNSDGKVDIADARFLVLHFSNPGGAACP